VTSALQIPLYGRPGVVGYALVDADRYDEINQWRWNLSDYGYATRHQYTPHSEKISMARYLLGLSKGDGLFADHINRDRLDNRLDNLRIVTKAENTQNMSKRPGLSSQYRGVCYAKTRDRKKKWKADAMVSGKAHHLGWFLTEEEAATAVRAFRLANMPGATD
jgi:hypothetical protein